MNTFDLFTTALKNNNINYTTTDNIVITTPDFSICTVTGILIAPSIQLDTIVDLDLFDPIDFTDYIASK